MKKLVAIFLIAVLAGSITIPNVFSDNGKNNSGTNENDNNGNQNNSQANENDNHKNQNNAKGNDNNDDKKENETKVHFGFSNATSVSLTLPNGTNLTFGFTNGTNPEQQISAFVHKVREAFKQEGAQAKKTIKDCREKAKNANPQDRKNILKECRAQLKQINQKFSASHKQFQRELKQLRTMIIGNDKEDNEKPQEKENYTKIQHTNQTVPKQYGQEHKQGKQKQKHSED